VAGNLSELQFGKSPSQQWFMALANHIANPDLKEQRKDQDDVQGFYIVGADGTSYGWLNEYDLERVNTFLDGGLADFKQRPPQRVEIPASLADSGFTITPDPSASLVRVFSRIRPLPPGCDSLNASVGRDHLWIFAGEVQEIVKTASQIGKPVPLPRDLVWRLARFHLIDNVRGEPDMWRRREVLQADFTVRLVRRQGTMRAYSLDGRFAQRTQDGQRGYEGTLEGAFDVDVRADHIRRFRAYADGQAWGVSTYTEGAPPGKFPLIIAMIEVDDPTAHIVPPQALSESGNLDHYQHAAP